MVERCSEISPRNATPEELLKVHSPDRIELLQGTNGSPDAEALEALSSGYDSIYIHPSTANLALLAAGSTIELVDAVIDDKVQNGFALIRYIYLFLVLTTVQFNILIMLYIQSFFEF